MNPLTKLVVTPVVWVVNKCIKPDLTRRPSDAELHANPEYTPEGDLIYPHLRSIHKLRREYLPMSFDFYGLGWTDVGFSKCLEDAGLIVQYTYACYSDPGFGTFYRVVIKKDRLTKSKALLLVNTNKPR